jgi:serine/threonine protein kinase
MARDASEPTVQSVGDYDLVEKIAEGGMGTVYKGRHRETGQIVAIKVVAPHIVGNQVMLKRFEKEYNAAKQLDHPHIVRAIEYGTTGDTPYLVMEFVEGESLGQKIERDGPMPEKEAVRLIAQVAQGLHRAHRERLVHRDVKPDNIMVTTEGVAGSGQARRPGAGQGNGNRAEPDPHRPRAGHAPFHGPRAIPQRQERRFPL